MLSRRTNYIVNVLILIFFAACAVTGILKMWFMPQGSWGAVYYGLAKSTWSMIHDWTGVAAVVLCVIHVIGYWDVMAEPFKSNNKKKLSKKSSKTKQMNWNKIMGK